MNKKNLVINTILIITLVTVAIFYIATIREGHYWGGDFSQYIHHAKNISEGKSYSDIGYIHNPYYPQFLGPESYPPIFPLILAPIYKFSGLNLTVMKIELIFFFVLSLLLIYQLFKRKSSGGTAIVLILILSFNPYFWHYKDYLHLDFAFIFFIYLSLLLIDYRQRMPANSLSLNLLSLVIGVTIYLATGIKGLGMTLIFSLALYDLLKNGKLSKSTIYSFLSFLVLLSIQYIWIHNDFTYLKNITLNPVNWLTNTVGYLKANLVLWDNSWIKFFRIILSMIFYTLLVAGYYKKIRTDFSILEVFVPVFFFSLVIYQYRYNQFLMAILPIMFFYALTGLSSAIENYSNNMKRVIVGIFVVIVFGGYLLNYKNQDYQPVNEGVETSDAISLFKKITEVTQKEDICIFWRPRVLTLYTDRPAATYHEAEDKELLNFFDEIKVAFVVTGPVDKTVFKNRPSDKNFIEFFDKFVKRNLFDFQLIYKNSSFELYRYIPVSSGL